MKANIDLSQFCDPESVRLYLRRPFQAGDMAYATDGKILVEVPCIYLRRKPQKKKSGERYPNCADLLNDFPTDGFKPWPKIQQDTERDFNGCLLRIQRVGSAWIDIRYDSLIRDLPNVEFVARSKVNAVAFRFTGGCGLVMPVDRRAKP